MENTKESILLLGQYNHVTALQFSDDGLFIGEGGLLSLYDTGEERVSHKAQVMSGVRIHAVCPGPDGLISVNGRNRIVLVSFDVKHGFRATKTSLKFNGWVLATKWMQGRTICVLDSNGFAYRVSTAVGDSADGDVSLSVLSSVRCPDPCILYSGCILGSSWSDAVLVCGTVFTQVLVWHPASERILHRLRGHDGVIFSVSWDCRSMRLASTSDDRSVRVWQLSPPPSPTAICQCGAGDERCVDCSCACSSEVWRRCGSADVQLIHSLYGHEARVWRCAFTSQLGDLLSVGEDSRVCLWSHDGRLKRLWKAHPGASVRALALRAGVLATGGADGGVTLWPLQCPGAVQQLPLSDVAPPDFLRSVTALSRVRCLLVTDAGRVLYSGLSDQRGPVEVLRDSRLSSYCLTAVSPDRRLVTLASIHGQLITLADNGKYLTKVGDQRIGDGKIYSMVWLNCSTLLVSYGDGVMTELSMKYGDGDCCVFTTVLERLLPGTKQQRWLSSACLVSELLVCGDRHGSLHVYPRNQNNPSHSLFRAHDRHGVTAVGTVPASDTTGTVPSNTVGTVSPGTTGAVPPVTVGTLSPCTTGAVPPGTVGTVSPCATGAVPPGTVGTVPSNGVTDDVYSCGRDGTVTSNGVTGDVYSCGRDGLLRRLCILGTADSPRLEPLQSLRLPWSWVSGFQQHAGQLLVFGFHGNEFVLRSVDDGRDVWRVVCGGGHRSWTLDLLSDPVNFSWVSGRQLMTTSASLIGRHPVCVQPGYRGGSTLSAVCVSAVGGAALLLVTGGEDGTLRLLQVGPDDGSLRSLPASATARVHLSSVRALCLVEGGRLASAGGRGQLVLWQLPAGDVRRQPLRALDSHRLQLQDPDAADVRFMQLVARRQQLAAASSDGYVRLFEVVRDGVRPLRRLHCGVECVLCVVWTDGGLLAAGTSGALTCWTDDGHVRWRQSGRHQSGINALHVTSGVTDGDSLLVTDGVPGGDLMLVTGGDDGAVSVSQLSTGEDLSTVHVANTRTNRSAHASQVTGVHVLDGGRSVLSVSLDQRLCVWSLDGDRFRLQACRRTDIADVKGVLVFDDSRGQMALVYGEGVELLQLHNWRNS